MQQQHGMAIGLDEYGNVYVTSVSAIARPEPALAFGTTVLTNVFTFVAKYDPAGNPLWARAPAMTNQAAVFALAVKDSAHVLHGRILFRNRWDRGFNPLECLSVFRLIFLRPLFAGDVRGEAGWSGTGRASSDYGGAAGPGRYGGE